MALPTHRVLPVILFTSAVFALSVCQVPSFNVPSERCVAPTLDYRALTTGGSDAVVFIYTMSPFTSSCSGRVVGYWFCYQSTSSTTGERVDIGTVLLLEDMGADYTIVRRFTVEAIPGRDCLSGGQCCVSRNLSAENQFGANSSYYYGVVDLQGGPNMNQSHISFGRPGYLFNAAAVSTQSGDKLRKSGNPTNQPLTMFQFIIANDTSTSATPTSASPATPSMDTSSTDTSSTETQVPSSYSTLPSTSDIPSFPSVLPTSTDISSSLAPTSVAMEHPTDNQTSLPVNNHPTSATVSATPTQQQSTDGQTGLPMSTIIILSAVIPSTLVLLMLVCTVVVIILIVRWRISRKQVDTAHEHFEMSTRKASTATTTSMTQGILSSLTRNFSSDTSWY